MTTKLYVKNVEEYKERINKKYLINETAQVLEIKNGILLPPKKKSNSTRNGIFSGGVATENYEFVSGMKRHEKAAGNYSCLDSYKVDTEIDYIDEEIIFGGIIIKHFGHAILEDLSRLWYIVKNKKDKRRVAFLCYNSISEYHYELFELVGLSRDRVLIIDKPTKFKTICVPEESLHSWFGYKKEYNLIYDEIRKNVKPKSAKKIYFTRTELNDSFDVNEKFFEQFYKKQGYKIIAPEKLSLREQIEYAAGAEELVCTLGTLSHFGLFMDYGSKLIIYNRTLINNLTPQYIINEARKLIVTYIDAILELLPVEHSGGCACMYPTEYFKEYLKDNNIDYDNQIKKLDKGKIIVQYLENYAKNYSRADRYFSIQQYDLYDVINKLSEGLLSEKVEKEKIFPKGSSYHLKKYWIKKNDEHSEEIKQLKKEIEELKAEKKVLQKKSRKQKSGKIISKLKNIIKRK